MKTKLFPLFAVLVSSPFAHGQVWNVADGDWNAASSWLSGVMPVAGSGETRMMNGSAYLTTAGLSQSFYMGGHPLLGSGNATMTVRDGGVLSAYGASYIGVMGQGSLNIQAGSRWSIGNAIQTYLGMGSGTGVVNVTGGGEVISGGGTYVGFGAGGTGSVNISGTGSVWKLFGSGGMNVGYNSSTGTLTLANGGKLTSDQSGSFVSIGGSGNGTFNIGNGGAAGIVEVGQLWGPAGSLAGKVNFNHNEAAHTFGTLIAGNLAVEQKGTGTTILTVANTYTKGTTITGGELRANNSTGSAFGTGAVIVGANTTLGGTGSFTGAATVNGTYAPGNSTGQLTSGSLTFGAGSVYEWEMNKAEGTVGSTTAGWDFAKVNGSLSFAPGSSISLVTLGLNQLAGDATGFNEGSNYVWNIASATGGITGWENLTIDSSGFQNAHNGYFGILASGNNLQLSYTAVPEPAAAGLAFVAGLAFCGRRRRSA